MGHPRTKSVSVQLLAELQERVCAHCIDHAPDGRCRSHDPKGCAILRFLPELVRLTRDIRSPRVDDYLPALRKMVCSHCDNSDDSGACCSVREALECGLFRYLPLVLETVEEWDRRQEGPVGGPGKEAA